MRMQLNLIKVPRIATQYNCILNNLIMGYKRFEVVSREGVITDHLGVRQLDSSLGILIAQLLFYHLFLRSRAFVSLLASLSPSEFQCF